MTTILDGKKEAKATPKKKATKKDDKPSKQMTLQESLQQAEPARDLELEATFDDEPPQDPMMAWQPECKRTKLSHAQELSMVDSAPTAESEMGDPNSENDACAEDGKGELANSVEHDEKLLKVKEEFQENVWKKLSTPVEPIDLD